MAEVLVPPVPVAEIPGPLSIYEGKLPGVLQVINYRARLHGLSREDEEDVAQWGRLVLWRQAVRGVTNIDCGLVATAAWSRQRYADRKGRATRSVRCLADLFSERDDGPDLANVPAPPPASIDVDDVNVSLIDVFCDFPAARQLFEDGLSPSRLVRRLKLSRY